MSVILTGFSSKIGNAIFQRYIKEKKTVFCLGRNDFFFNEVKNIDYKKFFFLDFNSNSFESDLEKLLNKLNPEDIETIIHAAADSGKRQSIRNYNYRDIKDLINVNHLNSSWFMKKSCDLLTKSKKNNKSFIYISTQLAKYKGPGLSIYSSSKAAMNNLCLSLAHEYGFAGIRVNIVSPGIVSDDPNPENYDLERLNIPLSRLATPEDVVNAVFFLSTEDSKYINGSNIDVNGGR